MALTREMQKELTMFARRMNRRIERASEGQRRSLEYNIRGYTTRQRSSGITVFSQAKAKTEQEYYKRMKELKAFEQAKTSVSSINIPHTATIVICLLSTCFPLH